MSTIKVTTIQDTAGANSSTTQAIANGIAKAWVNFNGTGTPSIRADYNVTTIGDNGTGDYTVNYETGVFSDTNYVIMGLGYGGGVYRGYPIMGTSGTVDVTRTTTSTRFQMYRGGSTTSIDDCIAVNVAVFR
jgi:hypothetical protein